MNIIVNISVEEFTFNAVLKTKDYVFVKGTGGDTLTLRGIADPFDVLFTDAILADVSVNGIVYANINDFIREVGVYYLFHRDSCSYGTNNWILTTGFWRDIGVWEDDNVWIDQL